MRHTKRRSLAVAAMLALIASIGAFIPRAEAQQPIRVGVGIAQTGPLAGGGKAALLALRMWVED